MSILVSTNPSRNYEKIGQVQVSTPQEVAEKVAAAHKAAAGWRDLGASGRIALLRQLSAKLIEYKQEFGRLQAEEAGMPINEALSDFDSAMLYFNSYLDKGEEALKPIITHETDEEIHEVFYEPYGVAACIVPWNFPFTNWVWQCGQVLVAGNTIVFKHSEETPLCGKLIEEVVNSVLPEGVFSEVYGDGSVGAELLNQDVNLICFTGSSATGIKIKQIAAGRLIHTCLELGGSAPGLLFADARVDEVLPTIIGARFSACGQVCDGLKRLIVHESQIDDVTDKLAEILTARPIGDASDPQTGLGPLVAQRQLDLLQAQVADAVEKGATVVVGGRMPDGLAGAYYEPTLLRDVTPAMRVWKEEVFGPVLPIVSFAEEDEAVAMANNTKYGLGAYIFTEDRARVQRVARQLRSGMVGHNTVSYMHVNNPFTGYGLSGKGREHAQFGFDEVSQIKVVSRQK
jgi:succinate-semialdehyde dehydrogenase/glutarate-semialdehyde dehydrogenase